jgi:hypothetical protein
MRNSLKVLGLAAVIAFAAFAPSAGAQQMSFKMICQDVGAFAPEPVGDHEGHMMSVDRYSCRMESGPMNGAVVSGGDVTNWDKGVGVEVLGNAAVRKPGGFGVYQDTEGKIALTIADGKVTGFTGNGKVHWVVATGSAAPLAGKTFSYTIKSTGAGQWEANAMSE